MRLFLIGAFQDIVHADLVEVSQCAQDPRRHHPLSGFVVGIGPLRNVDCGANLGLRQIVVLP